MEAKKVTMSKSMLKIGLAGMSAVLCLYASRAYAAELYSTTPTRQVYTGDTALVEVRINTEGEQLNAVEGVLHVEGGVAKISDISLGGSVLTIWPRMPVAQVMPQGIDIFFTGGVPGGFTQSDALLFKIAVTPEKSGKVVIQPEQIVSYKNDGRGTKVLASMSSLTLTVLQSEGTHTNSWEQAVSSDVMPPAPFTITIGQSSSVYDNKRFISFNTTDAETGVDRYEVIEGSSPSIRAESPYVLRNQSTSEKISVIAFDKAGNKTVATWEPERRVSYSTLYAGMALGILCILIVLICVVRRRKKTK